MTSSEPTGGTRWPIKWWRPMATRRKIPSNTKPSNILIKVTSDAVEETSHQPQPSEQTSLKQISDGEIAFV